MIQTLVHLNHHVRTAFGDLELAQGYNMWHEGVVGIGQGNGVGPHIWAAVSMPLFNIMRQEGFVASFICTLLHQHKALAGLVFVDDTDLIVNDASNLTDMVKSKMQCSFMMWHGLLMATGGNLVPDKCFWYLINFKWQNQQWKYKSNVEEPGRISVNLGNKILHLPRLKPSEAQRMLGVQLAPDGNDLAEAQHLKEVAAEWGRYMV